MTQMDTGYRTLTTGNHNRSTLTIERPAPVSASALLLIEMGDAGCFPSFLFSHKDEKTRI